MTPGHFESVCCCVPSRRLAAARADRMPTGSQPIRSEHAVLSIGRMKAEHVDENAAWVPLVLPDVAARVNVSADAAILAL